MDDKISMLLIVDCAFAVTCVGLIIAGLIVRSRNKAKHERCTLVTNGKVADITISNDSDGGSTQHPVFSYEVGGKQYVKTSSVGSTNTQYAIGDDVVVHYNPSDPHEYFIEGYKLEGFTWIILVAMGIFIATMAAIVSAILLNAS